MISPDCQDVRLAADCARQARHTVNVLPLTLLLGIVGNVKRVGPQSIAVCLPSHNWPLHRRALSSKRRSG